MTTNDALASSAGLSTMADNAQLGLWGFDKQIDTKVLHNSPFNLGSSVSDTGFGYQFDQAIAPGHPIYDMLGPPGHAHSAIAPGRSKYADDAGGLHPSYVGSNMFVRDTVNQAAVQTATFYISKILPYKKSNDLHIKWDVSRMDRSIVGQVPEEGVSKLIRSSRYQKNEKIERRGLAMQIEKSFFETPDGIRHFKNEMIGLVQSVQNTLNLGCMTALVCSADRQSDAQQLVQSRNIIGQLQPAERSVVNFEVEMYASFVTSERACERLVATAKQRMGRFGFTPDALLLPPGAQHYLAFAPERTLAAVGGPNIEQSFEECSGLKVYSADYIETSPGLLACPLVRQTSVGEFYTAPKNLQVNLDGMPYSLSHKKMQESFKKYSTRGKIPNLRDVDWQPRESRMSMSIMILYDEESDCMRKLRLSNAIDQHSKMRPYDSYKEDWANETKNCLLAVAQWANTINIDRHTTGETRVSPDSFVNLQCFYETATNQFVTKYSICATYNDLDPDLWGATSNEKAGDILKHAIEAQSKTSSNHRRSTTGSKKNKVEEIELTLDLADLNPANPLHKKKMQIWDSVFCAGKVTGSTFEFTESKTILSTFAFDAGLTLLTDSKILQSDETRSGILHSLQAIACNTDTGDFEWDEATDIEFCQSAPTSEFSATQFNLFTNLYQLVKITGFLTMLRADIDADIAISLASVPEDTGTGGQPRLKRLKVTQKQTAAAANRVLDYCFACRFLLRTICAQVFIRDSAVPGKTTPLDVAGQTNFTELGMKLSAIFLTSRFGCRLFRLSSEADSCERLIAYTNWMTENPNFLLNPHKLLPAALPYRVLVTRPWITHNMGTAVAVDTKKAGNTYYGNNDFKICDDSVSNVYHGNLTFYSKSIVQNPEAVKVYENVFPCGYVHGCCTRNFVPAPAETDGITGEPRPCEAGRGDARKDDGSIIALMVPPNSAIFNAENKHLFDLTGVLVMTSDEQFDTPSFQKVTHEQGPYLFCRLDGAINIRRRPVYYDMLTGSCNRLAEDEIPESRGMRKYTPIHDDASSFKAWRYNTAVFLGAHISLNENDVISGAACVPQETNAGTGHWTSHATPGSAAARSGLPRSIDEAPAGSLRSHVERRERGVTGQWYSIGGRSQPHGTALAGDMGEGEVGGEAPLNQMFVAYE